MLCFKDQIMGVVGELGLLGHENNNEVPTMITSYLPLTRKVQLLYLLHNHWTYCKLHSCFNFCPM